MVVVLYFSVFVLQLSILPSILLILVSMLRVRKLDCQGEYVNSGFEK